MFALVLLNNQLLQVLSHLFLVVSLFLVQQEKEVVLLLEVVIMLVEEVVLVDPMEDQEVVPLQDLAVYMAAVAAVVMLHLFGPEVMVLVEQ